MPIPCPARPHRAGSDVEVPRSNASHRSHEECAEEGIIGQPGKTHWPKQDREKARQRLQLDKEERVLNVNQKSRTVCSPGTVRALTSNDCNGHASSALLVPVQEKK
jgi:hypothetical protein